MYRRYDAQTPSQKAYGFLAGGFAHGGVEFESVGVGDVGGLYGYVPQFFADLVGEVG
jgi:hypothetical protein